MRRIEGQNIAGFIMDSMYKVEPGLMKYYGRLAPTAQPDKPGPKYWVEFMIVPSERVHVEMMESLNKYIF